MVALSHCLSSISTYDGEPVFRVHTAQQGVNPPRAVRQVVFEQYLHVPELRVAEQLEQDWHAVAPSADLPTIRRRVHDVRPRGELPDQAFTVDLQKFLRRSPYRQQARSPIPPRSYAEDCSDHSPFRPWPSTGTPSVGCSARREWGERRGRRITVGRGDRAAHPGRHCWSAARSGVSDRRRCSSPTPRPRTSTVGPGTRADAGSSRCAEAPRVRDLRAAPRVRAPRAGARPPPGGSPRRGGSRPWPSTRRGPGRPCAPRGRPCRPRSGRPRRPRPRRGVCRTPW